MVRIIFDGYLLFEEMRNSTTPKNGFTVANPLCHFSFSAAGIVSLQSLCRGSYMNILNAFVSNLKMKLPFLSVRSM